MSEDVTQQLVDSVMGNLKALLQEMADQSNALHKQWVERSRENQDRNSGWNQFEPTEQEERDKARRQRECDELYDKAQTVRECMNTVARRVSNIIGENIVIQFSKWNMQ